MTGVIERMRAVALVALFPLLVSCLTLNYHRPETLAAGSPGLDTYGGYYYVPAITGDEAPVNYALGYHFGFIGRMGLTDFSEFGIKLAPPESCLYYKHRLTDVTSPIICTGVAELGFYSECPSFNQIVMVGYPIAFFTPYAGFKNLFIMGLEGTMFDMSFMGDLFLAGELNVIPHVSFMIEYNYSFLWRVVQYGSSSLSFGVSVY